MKKGYGEAEQEEEDLTDLSFKSAMGEEGQMGFGSGEDPQGTAHSGFSEE